MSGYKDKVTPGPWGVRTTETGNSAIFNSSGIWIAWTLRKVWRNEDIANAKLIAEAGTVLHETGRTPRELFDSLTRITKERDALAEQRAELLAALRRYRSEVPLGHQPHMIVHEVDALISKCENGGAN